MTYNPTSNPMIVAGVDQNGNPQVISVNQSGTLAGSSNARCILIPGAITAPYVIATKAQLANTAGTPSYQAQYCQSFVSVTGGNQSITLVDGQTVTVNLIAGFKYTAYVTQFNVTPSVSDLQIFV
jgi:hypothetical protein